MGKVAASKKLNKECLYCIASSGLRDCSAFSLAKCRLLTLIIVPISWIQSENELAKQVVNSLFERYGVEGSESSAVMYVQFLKNLPDTGPECSVAMHRMLVVGALLFSNSCLDFITLICSYVDNILFIFDVYFWNNDIVPSALNNPMNRWYLFLQWHFHESPPSYVNDPIGRCQGRKKNTHTVKHEV